MEMLYMRHLMARVSPDSTKVLFAWMVKWGNPGASIGNQQDVDLKLSEINL